MVKVYSTCLQCWRLIRNYYYIWRGIAYVWYPMTFPANGNMHKLNYVTDTIGWSLIQPSLIGEARGTERAEEIEPIMSVASNRAPQLFLFKEDPVSALSGNCIKIF